MVHIGNGDFLKAYGKGNINVNTFYGEKWNKNHLADVLYVPDLSDNLFSSCVALDKGLKQIADNKVCKFLKNGQVVAMGLRKRQFIRDAI